MPNGVVTHLEARLLHELVNREIHPIRCAESCKRKYQKGMRIGDLCAETGHFWWAQKVWSFTAALIEEKDYDDWNCVWFDNKWVSLHDVISETEYELLERRVSDLWRALGYPEYAWWDKRIEYLASQYFGTSYYGLYGEKYDGYYDILIGEWEEEMEGYRTKQEAEMIFREGQGELPPCSQDFHEFWHDGPRFEDFSFLDY